ncbi:hypothetical protein G6F21_014310 [Rhizopus arrhizus]|nr:hypothetical protein G6F21_014310 [Rhizopus arrhizus]
MKSCRAAAAVRLRRTSRPSVAARRRSTRCCAIRAWRKPLWWVPTLVGTLPLSTHGVDLPECRPAAGTTGGRSFGVDHLPGHAAVGDEVLAGGEAGQRRQQVHRQRADVLGAADTADRVLGVIGGRVVGRG